MKFSYNKVFLIGIGGVGMSALAGFFLKKGIKVFGYDREESNITRKLSSDGASIFYELKKSNLDTFIKDDKSESLVVYTPAINRENIIFIFFKENNYVLKKRSEVLESIICSQKNIAVAGTHGKTTITALISHILNYSGVEITAFIGGFLSEKNTNFIFSNKPKYFIVEADEYDKSFLRINPYISVISSLDLDHVDIYRNHDDLIFNFNVFLNKTEKMVISHENVLSDLKIKNTQVDTYDDVPHDILNKKSLKHIDLILPGKHNIANLNAAVITCLSLGLKSAEINNAICDFKGILRRFQFHEKKNFILIEDYAHHPKEISATLNAVSEMYLNKKITVFFQPHLFSRTDFFLEDFAKSLSIAENVILYEIYGAREKNQGTVNSLDLLKLINANYKSLIKETEIDNVINHIKPDLVVVLGAGDITKSVKKIHKSLKNNS
ncbi:MAG: UDP-N-acetylmuramate--L-alanine ligase [Flavobacteriales bacterium]|nr:UDP-N-acetylmuramate--L-alanine ligase [Flavobacteriales bacterium]